MHDTAASAGDDGAVPDAGRGGAAGERAGGAPPDGEHAGTAADAGDHVPEDARAHARRLAEAGVGDVPTSGTALGLGEDGFVDGADGVRLHYVARGEGPLVVLLHGFPDFWYAWRHQLAPLAAAGFRVVAPDLRGYHLSDRPPRLSDYGIAHLVGDVAALVRALAPDRAAPRAHLVGHDWGGAIAWHLAAAHPELVDRLAILNAPHPGRFGELLRSTPAQMVASSYAGFFQLPALPELALGAAGSALLLRTLRTMHLRPGAFDARDAALYRAVFPGPEALRAPLHYYRAYARRDPGTLPRESRRVPHPTRIVWGVRDPALLEANVEGLERWVPDHRVTRVPDAGHWVMSDAPEVTNAALLEHFRGAA